MKCVVCGNEFDSKRPTAKYCSGKCRAKASRDTSIVQEDEKIVLDDIEKPFRFYIKSTNSRTGEVTKHPTRTASNWFNVPVAAIPIIEKGDPPMPDYMNGRQYFLWRKNNFKVDDNGKIVIYNPYPVYDKVEYIRAAEGSRRLGA